MKKFVIDKSNSEIKFSVRYMVISSLEGTFKNFDCEMKSKKKDFTDMEIQFSCETNSIFTNFTDRDNHLKANEFFDCENFPLITFKSEKIDKEADVYILFGNLEIKGINRGIKLIGNYEGKNDNKHRFNFTGSLRREEFGLNLKIMNGKGNPIVSDEIKLKIDVQMIEQ